MVVTVFFDDDDDRDASDRKAELRAMIESGGGEYMGAMEARTTSHLVAEVLACLSTT